MAMTTSAGWLEIFSLSSILEFEPSRSPSVLRRRVCARQRAHRHWLVLPPRIRRTCTSRMMSARTPISVRRHFLLVAVLFIALAQLSFVAGGFAANALRGNPSPYLAMHGEDPVQWRDWGPDILAEATDSGRPIFISSGYFACHWCHVMQRESYRDPAIAALLNDGFIPVKLDRELHPALDAYLIDFTERTAGRAGWPLNVFLTPEGYPFVGLTYAPPAEFRALLQQITGVWSEQREQLQSLARRGAKELAAAAAPPVSSSDATEPSALMHLLRQQALSYGDLLAGGFGRQTRFPMAPNLLVLLQLQARAPDPELGAFLRLTLDAIAGNGLRDHLDGGFFRYTVDPDWSTPHFEKMLYTQALLIPVFLKAAAVLDEPRYRLVARDTLRFLVREMRADSGGYVASFSAVDGSGVEGGYYLWTNAQLERLLSPDERRLAARVWGLGGMSTYEAGQLPIEGESLAEAAKALGLQLPSAEVLLASARSKLLKARSNRGLPVDDKQLAGWNGLALSALVAGARALDDAELKTAAQSLRDFLVEGLVDGTQLHRARSNGNGIGAVALSDYAYVAQGLLDWSNLAGDPADRALALNLVRVAWQSFRDQGGWRQDASPLLPSIPSEAAFADGPLPSPSAVLVSLAFALGDATLTEKAAMALESAAGTAARNPFSFAGDAWQLIGHGKTSAP